MKKMRKWLVVALAAVMLMSLASCSSSKTEITKVAISDSKVLNIQYSAGDNIPASDAKFKISVTSEEGNLVGTAYCISDVEQDLEKGKKYIGLFDLTTERAWTGEEGLTLNNTVGVGEIKTSNILGVFGDDATMKVEMLVKDEPVSEMTVKDLKKAAEPEQ